MKRKETFTFRYIYEVRDYVTGNLLESNETKVIAENLKEAVDIAYSRVETKYFIKGDSVSIIFKKVELVE